MKKRLLLLALASVCCIESSNELSCAQWRTVLGALVVATPGVNQNKREFDAAVPVESKDITSAMASQLKNQEQNKRRAQLALQQVAQKYQKVSDTSANRPTDPRNGARNQTGRKTGCNKTMSRQANRREIERKS